MIRNIYKYLVTQEIYRKGQDCQEKVNKVKMIHTPHDHGLNRPFSFSNIGIPLYIIIVLYCITCQAEIDAENEKRKMTLVCVGTRGMQHTLLFPRSRKVALTSKAHCANEKMITRLMQRKTQRWPPYDSSCHNLMTWKIFCGYTLALDLSENKVEEWKFKIPK